MTPQPIPTLPDAPTRLDHQAFFNAALGAVVAQGVPALRDGDNCSYRTPDYQLACAIGQFVPDEIYSPKMEGVTAAQALKVVNPNLFLDDNDEWFLDAIQTAHDESAIFPDNFVEEFTSAMTNVASNYGLEMPPT